MWIVAIGWIYVVILMAATETSVVAGVMTFLIYCMIPLSILFYLTGSKRRRARRAAAARPDAKGDGAEGSSTLAATSGPGASSKCGPGSDAGCDGGDGGGGGGD